MTRCASPNGAVEFCYDFPVASTSTSPAPSPTTSRHHHTQTRPRSPQHHRRRPTPSPVRDLDLDDDEDDEQDARALRIPTPTGNQWTQGRAATLPALLSPSYYAMGLPSSYESERSVLSSLSNKQQPHNKIRKPRRSVDEPSAPTLAPPLSYTSSSGSSAPSSPYSLLHDDFSDSEDVDTPEFDEEENAPERPPSPAHVDANCDTSMAIKKQWAALSLRVRFGVFRAKRRMRDRVLSL